MIIKNISIRSKLILTTLILVLLLIFLALIYLDASMRVAARADFLEEVSIRKGEEMRSLLEKIEGDLRLTGNPDSAREMRTKTDMALLGACMEDLNRQLADAENRSRPWRDRLPGISLGLGIFILAGILLILTRNIRNSFRELSAYTQKLAKGSLPPPLDSSRADEFGELAAFLNEHTRDLQEKIDLLGSMSREGPGKLFTPGADDELGSALLVLSDYHTRRELNEVTRNREDKKENWISEGQAQLGEVLRSERDNVDNLSFLIIQKLVTYMKMEMGSLFLTNDSDPDHLTLDLVASYAYDRRKFISMNLEWGEGLPGTCALEKGRIFITDVPPDYFQVVSGLGSSLPNCILLIPLLIADQVFGVIELATVRLLRPFEIDFVESLSERIASSLMTVRNNERTALLLKQSQEQAKTLREQEAAMRESMQKLELAQQDSSARESEISAIISAVNQSTLVAELGLNGRFTSINERFLMLLESSEDQVIGKHYSDFAIVDRVSEEYKAFWASLKEGKIVSNTQRYRLFSGEDLWLQQTLTPIMSNQGRVNRILNIAMNVSDERSLQEQLRTRELENTRRGLDMQTLNQAVNSSLIKCELDAEGIILLVNDKYCEVSGYGRKELLGRNYRLFLKDLEKEQFETIWNEVLKEKVYEGSVRRTKPTGEEVWLASTFSPVKDESGRIYKVYFMGLDITEKRLKYQLLEEANNEIQRLRKRLEEMEL